MNTSTIYRLARQGDYPKLHRFAEAVAMHDVVYQKPTIVVERDGQLVGFAATRRWGERVTVGPVVIGAMVRLKGLVAIRAVLEIEKVLKAEGRRYYLIGTTDAGLMRICEAFGCTRLDDHDGESWWLEKVASGGEGMSSSKPPGPSRAEIALQQQQTMALGSQTALLEQQAARQEEQYRQQQQLAPLLYEQMGLRPQYNEQGAITGFSRFETPEQALYREQIETMRAQQPQQAALQQQYLTLAQQQADYQARQQPIQERLQQQYLTLAEQQAAAQERQQPGQERLQALYLDIAEQQAKSQQLEAAWQQETAPQRKAQIENELRIQNQTLAYQETALRQYQEQQKMQPLLYEQAGVKPIYDEAGNITSFGLTEEGQKRQDYESQLLDRQRKALAGELPVDPTLERTLQEGEAQLRASLQAQLGTGYETSTPGIQALAEFSRRAAEARFNVAHGQLVSGQNLLANEQALMQQRQAGATSGRGMIGEYGLKPVSFGQGVQAGGQPNYLGQAQNAAPGMSQYSMPGLFTGGSPTASAAGYQAAVGSPYGTLGQFGDIAKQYGSLVSSGGNLVSQLSGQREKAYQQYQQGAAQSGGIWGTGLGIVGAAAGAYFGGPAGASAGWTLGSAAGQHIGRATY